MPHDQVISCHFFTSLLLKAFTDLLFFMCGLLAGSTSNLHENETSEDQIALYIFKVGIKSLAILNCT